MIGLDALSFSSKGLQLYKIVFVIAIILRETHQQQ